MISCPFVFQHPVQIMASLSCVQASETDQDVSHPEAHWVDEALLVADGMMNTFPCSYTQTECFISNVEQCL